MKRTMTFIMKKDFRVNRSELKETRNLSSKSSNKMKKERFI